MCQREVWGTNDEDSGDMGGGNCEKCVVMKLGWEELKKKIIDLNLTFFSQCIHKTEKI